MYTRRTLTGTSSQSLGPFVDCTSNQAIAFNEVQKSKHDGLIQKSIELSKTLIVEHSVNVTPAELAVEIAVFLLLFPLWAFRTESSPDGQIATRNLSLYYGIRPCPNKSL
jgi:hypothetical protein